MLVVISACGVDVVPGAGADQQVDAVPSAAADQQSSESAASTSAALTICPNGDGHYCGGHGCGGDPVTLHACAAGKLTPARVCSNGCEPVGAGASDRCASPPPMPACPSGDGQYCGGHGFDGDGDTLYECAAGRLSVARVCSNGCEQTGGGAADRCAAPAALAACPNGDGQYCGGHGFTGDGDVLIDCSAGTFSNARVCANGCARVGDGAADFCEAPPAPMFACPAGDGLYCGTHGIAGNADILYSCSGGELKPSQVCDYGCDRAGAGAYDRCATWPAPRPACPNGDGLYCGGHGFTADSGVLHSCVGGHFSVSRVCTLGCNQIGLGAIDGCLEDLLLGALPPPAPSSPPAIPGGTSQPAPNPGPQVNPLPNPAPAAGGGAPPAPIGNGAGAPPPSTNPPAPGPGAPR